MTGGSGSFTGGLVGQNDGNIYNSQSIATVKASGESDSSVSASFGGAVGYNTGQIALSTAAGNVDGGAFGNFVGGFAGQNLGLITTSSAGGNVHGAGPSSDTFALIGGLVGQNGDPNAEKTSGIVVFSSATGNVTGGDNTIAPLPRWAISAALVSPQYAPCQASVMPASAAEAANKQKMKRAAIGHLRERRVI